MCKYLFLKRFVGGIFYCWNFKHFIYSYTSDEDVDLFSEIVV